MFKNKKVLVTGGTGMVGRELVQLLHDRGAIIKVVSLDKPLDFTEDVEFIKKDLMNDNFKGHHDSDKLSNEIMKIIEK